MTKWAWQVVLVAMLYLATLTTGPEFIIRVNVDSVVKVEVQTDNDAYPLVEQMHGPARTIKNQSTCRSFVIFYY